MKAPGVGSYIARARKLTRGRAASDLLYTLGGRGVQMLLGLAGSVVSARALGPVDLGRFGLVMATVTISGTVADAGLTYTAIKFIAQHNADDEARSHATGRAYLLLRLCTGVTVALLGLLLSEPVALLVLGQPDLVPYLQLGFLTLFSLALSSYPGTVLVALALFRRLSIVTVLNAAITVAGILTLALLGKFNAGDSYRMERDFAVGEHTSGVDSNARCLVPVALHRRWTVVAWALRGEGSSEFQQVDDGFECRLHNRQSR